MANHSSDHIAFSDGAVLRRFLLTFLTAAFSLLLVVAMIYRQDILHQRLILEQEAQHVLDLQQELLAFEFQAVQSDLRYLANQALLARFLSDEASHRGDLEREYVNFALNKSVYDQVRFLGTNGEEIIRINHRDGNAVVVPRSELQSKRARYYYQEALSLGKGQVFVSPFDLNVEHGTIERPVKPVIRFLTPVCGASEEKRGLLVLNYLGAHVFTKLQQISSGFPGQTMLVNSEGEYLQAHDPSYEWGWLLDLPHSFRRDYPQAWNRGKRFDEGPFRVGENLFRLKHVRPVRRLAVKRPASADVGEYEPSDLMLVAYVSSSVANAHSNKLLNQMLVLYAAVMVVVAVLSLYWARSGIIRKHHEKRITESEARLRQLSSLLLAAQETERRHLSRDLHDELGQQVTAISLDLRSLDTKDSGAHSHPLLRRAIEEVEVLLTSLHRIATRVRPSLLDDLGLEAAVASFLSEYQQRTGIQVAARFCIDRDGIPVTVRDNAYRILQEALANVAAHADVGRAEVAIHTSNEQLHIDVRDSGVGFDPEDDTNSHRLGILGMRERVELLNGRFELKSTPGQGTSISISIPLQERTL